MCPRELAVGIPGTAVMDNDDFKEDTLTGKTSVSFLLQTISTNPRCEELTLLDKILDFLKLSFISFRWRNIAQNKLNVCAAGVFGFNY